MKKPKLILHIGHSKCGSTSIQRYLSANQKKMLDNRFYLFGHQLDLSRDCNVKAAPNAFLSVEKNLSIGLEKIAKASEDATPEDTFILSAEILCQPKYSKYVQQFMNYYDIQIVHYIRNQADWCYSAWKQWQLKRGKDLDTWVDACAQNLRPGFWETFTALMNAGFNEQNYSMRILNKKFLYNEDLLDDFCSVIALNNLAFDKPLERSNPNMDHAILDVLKSSGFMFENSHDNRIYDWLLECFPDELTAIRSTLSLKQRKKIQIAHLESNERILNQFFKGKEKLFWEVFSSDDHTIKNVSSTPVGDEFAEQLERLRRALGYTIGALSSEQQKNLKRMESAESKIKSLERKIKQLQTKL